MKKDIVKTINEVLKEIDGLEPLVEFKEPMPELSQEMLYGLAQIYTIKGFRDYLQNSYLKAMKNAALSSDNELLGSFFKGRAITIKELLSKAKKSYEEFEKVTRLKKNAVKEGEKQESGQPERERVS